MIPAYRETILLDIINERRRQETLKAAGKFPHTMADPDCPTAVALAALGEEFGEVCTEVLGLTGDTPGVTAEIATRNLRTELIQVAAIAVAWVEKLDGVKPEPVEHQPKPQHVELFSSTPKLPNCTHIYDSRDGGHVNPGYDD